MADTSPPNLPADQDVQAPKAALSTEDFMAYGCVLFCSLAGLAAVALMVIFGWNQIDDLTKPDAISHLVPLASHELAAARVEHNALVELASVCPTSKTDMTDVAAILDLGPVVSYQKAPETGSDTASGHPLGSRPMSGYLMAAVYLSHAIGRARVEVATTVANNDLSRQIFEWAIVLIGAGSTVLVSLKSAVSSNKSSVSFALGVLAIVSSALATSASSLNAFYSPRIEYEKSQHLLTSLQHLHASLVAGMTREAGVVADGTRVICAPIPSASWDKDWKFRVIKNYSDKFQTILAAANVGISATDGETLDMQSPADGPVSLPPLGKDSTVVTSK